MARKEPKEQLPVPLSRERADALIEAFKVPLPLRWAAASEGVTPHQVESWLMTGLVGGDPECVRFAKAVYKLQSGNIGKTLKGLLELAEKGNPVAAESFLKLMHPADFGGTVRTEPDEFQAAERNRARRKLLLADPPPRMRAELTAHRWVQLPEKLSAKDKATIDGVLARYRKAPLLSEGTEKAK